MTSHTRSVRAIYMVGRRHSGIRNFSQSSRALVNPLANLSHFSAAKEAQFLSKERKLPREEFHPHLQLIRSSEVDPFAPVPGTSPETITKLREAASGRIDAETTYKLAITNLVSQLEASRAEAENLRFRKRVLQWQNDSFRSLAAYAGIIIAVSLPVLAFYLGRDRTDPNSFGRTNILTDDGEEAVSVPSHNNGQIVPAVEHEIAFSLEDLRDLLEHTLSVIGSRIFLSSRLASPDDVADFHANQGPINPVYDRTEWPPVFQQIFEEFMSNVRQVVNLERIEIDDIEREGFRQEFVTASRDIMNPVGSGESNEYASQHMKTLNKQFEIVQRIAASFNALSPEQQTRLLDDVLSVLYPQFSKTQPRSFLSRCFWASPPVPIDRGLLSEELKDLKMGATTLRMHDGWLVIEDNNGFRVPLVCVLESEVHHRHRDHQDKSDKFCTRCRRRALLTGEELKWISRRAAQMAKEVTDAQRAQILDMMPEQKRMKFEAAGLDPVAIECRFYATRELEEAQKRGARPSLVCRCQW